MDYLCGLAHCLTFRSLQAVISLFNFYFNCTGSSLRCTDSIAAPRLSLIAAHGLVFELVVHQLEAYRHSNCGMRA